MPVLVPATKKQPYTHSERNLEGIGIYVLSATATRVINDGVIRFFFTRNLLNFHAVDRTVFIFSIFHFRFSSSGERASALRRHLSGPARVHSPLETAPSGAVQKAGRARTLHTFDYRAHLSTEIYLHTGHIYSDFEKLYRSDRQA